MVDYCEFERGPPVQIFVDGCYRATPGFTMVSHVASDGFKHTKAHYFVWSFLACHLACIVLLRDYGGDIGLLAVCVTWPVWTLCRGGFVQQCQCMAIFSIDVY